MPLAKRRKVSNGQEVETSVENGNRCQLQDGSLMTVESDQTEKDDDEVGDTAASVPTENAISTSEKELSKRGRSKSLGEVVFDIKTKEDAVKPVRISERLSIKRNRIGDEDEGDSPAPTPKKQKTSSAPKQPKKAPSSTTVVSGVTKSTSAVVAPGTDTGTSTSQKHSKKRQTGKKAFTPWSMEEMAVFFTYIGEHGKNFDLIDKRMACRAKRKGVKPRNKLQIRYLYYRTVAKISRILEHDVKTCTQEVLSMINFGALRKYMKETNPQFSKCLKELNQYGKATFSKPNKRYGRVQTPMCKYLKKLEKVEVEVPEKRPDPVVLKLPTHVTIELTPKNSSAWSRVQEMSQNPRVRFKLSTNRTLESVFKHLNGKWKPHWLRLKEAMGEKSEVSEDELSFHVPSSSQVTPFTMKPIRYQKTDGPIKCFVEKVFPNLLVDLKDTDESEVEQEGMDGIVEEDKMGTYDASPFKDALTPEKIEPGTVMNNDEQTNGCVEDKSNVWTEKKPIIGTSSGVSISISCPEGPLMNGNQSGEAERVEKTEGYAVIKSEPCDEEETSGESTSDQYLDFTPNGNLTVVSKSKSQAKSISVTASSSSISTTLSSSSSSSSATLKTKPLTTSQCSSPSSAPPSSTLSSSSSSPSQSTSSSPSNTISSPLRSLTSALNLKPVSNVSPPPSSSNSTSTNSHLSPSLNNKKGAKKKINFCDNKTVDSNIGSPESNMDSNPNSQNPTTDSQSGRANNNNNNNYTLMKEVDKEFERLQALAKSGFLLSNSNTVTLLHLCLLFGRASVIRLEYQWVNKPSPQSQQNHSLPAFCSTSNPIANSLRRLCHIAALELASFRFNHKHLSSTSKEKSKPETAEVASSVARKKVSVRNFGTMTDTRITMPRHTIHHQHHHRGHAHLRQHNHNIDSTAMQMNGVTSGEVFRVPLVPAPYHSPVMTKEEEEKLKMQQQEAKAIMQDCSNQRSRLLKRRNVRTRSKPIIVQRTLLPKVPNERIITYVQPPTSHGQVMVTKGPLDTSLAACGDTAVMTTDSMEASKESLGVLSSVTVGGDQPCQMMGTNILEMAVRSANIMPSPEKDTSPTLSLSDGDASHMTLQATPLSTPSHHSLTFSGRDSVSLSLADQSNISISDLDISLTSTSMSNLGPDAGDKFLDSVLERSQHGFVERSQHAFLERSQHGFAGLITPVVKSFDRSTSPHQPPVIGLDSSLSAFDLSGMKTPSRPSSPSSSSPPSKVSPHPDQSWMAGESADVSLSSILGAFSSFQGRPPEPQLKTPSKTSSMRLFDQSSSDAVTVVIPKPDFVSDVSLNSFLGDSNLSSPVIKTEHPHHHPQPPSLFSEVSQDHPHPHVSLAPPPPSLFSEVSQDSLAKLDVDVTLQGMVNDSSVDLVSKFEKLAAQMAEGRQEQEVVTKPNLAVKESGSDHHPAH